MMEGISASLRMESLPSPMMSISGLIELPETAPLGPLAPVDLADLVTAEGEGEVVVVQGHVFGQGNGQVKAQGQVGVALGEAVDLLFRLAAAFGQQDLAGFDDRRVQGGKTVEGIGFAQDLHNALHLLLGSRQQFHEAGEGSGSHFCHAYDLLCSDYFDYSILAEKIMLPSQNLWDESETSLRGATQIQGPAGLLWPPGTGREPWTFPSPLRRCPSSGPNRALSALRPSLWSVSGVLLRHHGGVGYSMRFCRKSQAMGRVEGLTMHRQSRSPRARPSTNISAVAMLLAKGMLFWSHSREI